MGSHGIKVTEGVGRCNRAKKVRIIHNRREKIDGLDDRKLIRELVNSRIIGCLSPNQQIGIVELWQFAQNLSEVLRTQLRRSTSAMTVASQGDGMLFILFGHMTLS